MRHITFILLTVLSIFLIACTPAAQEATIEAFDDSSDLQNEETQEEVEVVEEQEAIEEAEEQVQEVVEPTDGLVKNDPIPTAAPIELIAGNQDAPYVEFTQEAYEQALAENKKVFLHWYATWCPSCRAEQTVTQNYFDDLSRDDVVGFRVNYKDSDTDEDEQNLAREFGVTAQGTKVFIVDGERVHKTPQHFVVNNQLDDAFSEYFGEQ